jgi:propionyl-CoA synthetase
VQRDTGGYAVALASSMKHIYCGGEGETYFSTSDIGWVVGHSYIIYGPLIAGMATVMYEGTPLRPDPGIWWQIVEKYKVNVMFSAPTAARVLKKQDPAYMHKYDLSSLKHIFMAGEPLDQPTHEWFMNELQKPVIDNYWQTETGWPMLAALPGVEKTPIKFGSPSFPVYGYNLKIFREDGSECGPTKRASLRSSRRCRRAACRPCGVRTTASSAPISRCSRIRLSTRPSTGRSRTTMATSPSSAVPTTSSTLPATV